MLTNAILVLPSRSLRCSLSRQEHMAYPNEEVLRKLYLTMQCMKTVKLKDAYENTKQIAVKSDYT